jgi:hypothetical protein
MVVAALVVFALLLIAWLAAPNRTLTAIPIQPEEPIELSDEAQRVLAAAA